MHYIIFYNLPLGYVIRTGSHDKKNKIMVISFSSFTRIIHYTEVGCPKYYEITKCVATDHGYLVYHNKEVVPERIVPLFADVFRTIFN